MWEPRRLTALWDSTVCYKDSFIFCTQFLELVKQVGGEDRRTFYDGVLKGMVKKDKIVPVFN
jgi:hypothetical protein